MYHWEENLETGYVEIDDQHKEWIAKLNHILLGIEEGRGKDEIFKTMEFLIHYSIKHFSAEEKLMKKYHYSDYSRHKCIHEEFKITIRNFTRQLIMDGPNDRLFQTILIAIGDWFINHIRGDDFRMAAYVKTKNQIINTVI